MESLSQLFDIFSEERRRYALYEWDQSDGPIEIAELAKRVREREDRGDDASRGAFDQVALTLKHHHLPKAARAEYVEFDREENEIRISGSPTKFQIILAVSEAIESAEQSRAFDPDGTTPEEFLKRLSSRNET